MADEYTKAFEKEGRELGISAASGEQRAPLFRDEEIELLLSMLSHRHSVLLAGPEGVGKTTVVYAAAHRLRREGGRRIREFSTIQLLAGTKYIGEWQTKLTSIIKAARKTRTILFITDVWNLPDVGKTSSSADNLWDALRPYLEKREVQLIGEVTPNLLDNVQKAAGFSSVFEILRLKPLPPEQVNAVIRAEAEHRGIVLEDSSCNRLVELCERFLPASQGPGPALRLLERAQGYAMEKDEIGEHEPMNAEFIDKVFSIYSGVPLFVVSRSAVRPVSEIRDWFRERIIGQESAIDAVVEMIALFKAGLHDPDKPIGAFMFVGPTGVGKTELARALATFLFGSPRRLLRFDLSEFKDYHAFEMLVGKPERPKEPARLLDPVRTNPFQVILLDELEKAHLNVWDLLLQVLDEGRLTPPRGQPVSFRNTIVIATSNVGADDAARRSIGFSPLDDIANVEGKLRGALEATFRPEFLNRFQQIVYFNHLSRAQVTQIARQEIKRVLNREGVTRRRLVVDVADEALEKVIDEGFDFRYGARALKREIRRSIVVPIATVLMERTIDPGSILKVFADKEGTKVRVVETAESRAHKRSREPVKGGDNKRYTRSEIITAIERLSNEVDHLAERVGEARLSEERQRLEELRHARGFWDDSAEASRITREIDHLNGTLARVDHLRERIQDMERDLRCAMTRPDIQRLTNTVLRLEAAMRDSWRALVSMGRDGERDAIVEIAPLGTPGPARDLLFHTYVKWADWHGLHIEMLREPLMDDESVLLGLRGDHAYGLLRLEAGHHRVRDGERSTVVRVRIVPWTDRTGEVSFTARRALKKTGQYGGRIRSRIEVAGMNLALQNAKTLGENRELAIDVAPSWAAAPPLRDQVVRRYDLKPFLIRDYMTGIKSGRPDVLKPKAFHGLLCQRVDQLAD